MSTKHSPLPWRVGLSPAFGYPLLLTSEGYAIADEINGITLETADANAAHIVKCVNLHDDLVAALKAWMEFNRETQAENPCPDVLLRANLRKKAKKMSESILPRASQ